MRLRKMSRLDNKFDLCFDSEDSYTKVEGEDKWIHKNNPNLTTTYEPLNLDKCEVEHPRQPNQNGGYDDYVVEKGTIDVFKFYDEY